MTPNINIKDLRKLKDKYGLLGKGVIDNQIKSFYCVDEKALYSIININIVNHTTENAELQIWISKAKVPTLEDLYESKIILEPDAIYARTNIVLDNLENVYVKCSNSSVIRIDGYEERTL